MAPSFRNSLGPAGPSPISLGRGRRPPCPPAPRVHLSSQSERESSTAANPSAGRNLKAAPHRAAHGVPRLLWQRGRRGQEDRLLRPRPRAGPLPLAVPGEGTRHLQTASLSRGSVSHSMAGRYLPAARRPPSPGQSPLASRASSLAASAGPSAARRVSGEGHPCGLARLGWRMPKVPAELLLRGWPASHLLGSTGFPRRPE